MKKVLKNREKSKMRRKSIFSLFVILMIVDCSLCSLVNLKNSSTSENENLTSQLLTCDDDDGKCKEIHRNHLHFVHKYDEYFLSPQNDDHHEYKNRLKHSSLIYGLLVTASENQLNQKCYKEIMQIYHGIHKKEIWAMKSESSVKSICWVNLRTVKDEIAVKIRRQGVENQMSSDSCMLKTNNLETQIDSLYNFCNIYHPTRLDDLSNKSCKSTPQCFAFLKCLLTSHWWCLRS